MLKNLSSVYPATYTHVLIVDYVCILDGTVLQERCIIRIFPGSVISNPYTHNKKGYDQA
jgi:hypothetical protein